MLPLLLFTLQDDVVVPFGAVPMTDEDDSEECPYFLQVSVRVSELV